MKVAIISAALPPLGCGEAASTWYLGRELAARGLDVHVVTTRRKTPPDEPPGTTVHAIMDGWGWREALRLVALLRAIGPDAVLLLYMGAMYGEHPMITFAPTLVRRALRDARFVTRFEHVSGGAVLDGRPAIARAARWSMLRFAGRRDVDDALGTLARDSDVLIALCETHGQRIRDVAPEAAERIAVIPAPSNVEIVADGDGEARRRGRARVGAGSGDFLIGFFGYVYPDKGIEILLRALAKTRARRPGARLLVLGGRSGTPGSAFHAYYDDMQRVARELGVDEAVTWIGGFPHGDPALPDLLHACDVWALPFDHGAKLNNSSLTSLASYGRAIVTTYGAIPEHAFVDRENVMLVPAGDVEALSRVLEELANDAALRARLAAGATRLARERLSWAAAGEATIRALRGDSDRPQREASGVSGRERTLAGSA